MLAAKQWSRSLREGVTGTEEHVSATNVFFLDSVWNKSLLLCRERSACSPRLVLPLIRIQWGNATMRLRL